MNTIDRSSRRKFIKAGGIVIASSMITTAGNLLAKEEEKNALISACGLDFSFCSSSVQAEDGRLIRE